MTAVLWLAFCVALGAAAGLHSGYWGGLGLLVIGVPAYFASPARFRARVPERLALAGAVLAFVVAAAILPVLIAVGATTP